MPTNTTYFLNNDTMGLNKMATFCRRYLRTHFLDRKLILDVPKMCNKTNLRDLIAATDLMNVSVETKFTFFGLHLTSLLTMVISSKIS